MVQRSCSVAVAALLWTSVAAAADPEGAILAASCFTCHGPDGVSPGEVPSIAELDAATLQAMLAAFRSGEIEGTIMMRIAKGYSDAEIAALAAYLAARQ